MSLNCSISLSEISCWLRGKESPCSEGSAKEGDVGSIPGLGRSSEEGNGNSFQYSGLENPMDVEPGGLQSTEVQRVGHDRVT